MLGALGAHPVHATYNTVSPKFGINHLRVDCFVSREEMSGVWPTRVYLLDFFCSGIQIYLLLSPYLCFISLLYLVIDL